MKNNKFTGLYLNTKLKTKMIYYKLVKNYKYSETCRIVVVFKKQILISSIVIFISIIFAGCFILKNDKQEYFSDLTQEKITIQGLVQIHYPYCGGASPPPELEQGRFSSMSNSSFFIVIKEDSSRTPVDSFITDKKGYFEIKLIPDEYSIFGTNKMLSFEEFIKSHNGDGQNTFSLGTECLQEWYNKPDFVLNAKNDTMINIMFYSQCYTGINPCLMYNGPYPP